MPVSFLRLYLCTLCIGTWSVVAHSQPYIVNGVALDVQRAIVAGKADLLAARVQHGWALRARGRQSTVVRREMRHRIVLARRIGKIFQSVSFTPGHERNSVEIFSSTTSLQRKAVPLDLQLASSQRWPLPHGTEIDSVMRGKDESAGTTITGRSHLSVIAFVQEVSAAARRRGWSAPYIATAAGADSRLLLWVKSCCTASLRVRSDHAHSKFVLVQTNGAASSTGIYR